MKIRKVLDVAKRTQSAEFLSSPVLRDRIFALDIHNAQNGRIVVTSHSSFTSGAYRVWCCTMVLRDDLRFRVCVFWGDLCTPLVNVCVLLFGEIDHRATTASLALSKHAKSRDLRIVGFVLLMTVKKLSLSSSGDDTSHYALFFLDLRRPCRLR